MPWPSRLLPVPSSSQNRSPNPSSDRSSPAAPSPPTVRQHGAFDPIPTLHPDRVVPSPSGPKSRDGVGQHRHGRSVSHPLPNIFRPKKSNPRLGDADVFDNAPDPAQSSGDLLDGPNASSQLKRMISGKQIQASDEEETIQRRCMCCDNRVRVPKIIDKFRCMACVTINDLRLQQDQVENRKRLEVEQGRANPSNRVECRIPMPISVERTRAIVDRCVLSYLDARCSVKLAQDTSSHATESNHPSTPTEQSEAQHFEQLTDQPMDASPPDTPKSEDLGLHATIKEFQDISLLPYTIVSNPNSENRLVTQASGVQPTVRAPEPEPAALPPRPVRKPPPPPVIVRKRVPVQNVPTPTAKNLSSPKHPHSPLLKSDGTAHRQRYDRIKLIFRPLEDYIAHTFGDTKCLAKSFCSLRPSMTGHTRSDSNVPSPPTGSSDTLPLVSLDLDELDPKMLLLGDIGENGSWWVGRQGNVRDNSFRRKKVDGPARTAITSKSPNIDWTEVNDWYNTVHAAGHDWRRTADHLKSQTHGFDRSKIEGLENMEVIDDELADARAHAIRALLKITENILKRPGHPFKEAEDLRWLLIILSNPSLYSSRSIPRTQLEPFMQSGRGSDHPSPKQGTPSKRSPGDEAGKHTGILKRVFGLLGNVPDGLHRYLIGWFMRLEEDHFIRLTDLASSFVTHRLRRSANRPRSRAGLDDGGLIPDLSGSAASTSAQLHSAMGLSGSVNIKKRPEDGDNETDWANDWQLKAVAKVMTFFFAANNNWQGKSKRGPELMRSASTAQESTPYANAKRSGQLLHTSTFYNTLLDYNDLIADFRVWESRRDKFSFCQYPLFLSMGAKIKILEYDTRRQMELKAREAYFDNVIRQRANDGFFHLRVRRDCLVDDSLRQISEAAGSGQEELKKGLRVHFTGEEGVDAGGPRKEWFLMIVRDIFDPNHGMFVYDDESNTCYFNPNSFETSQEFFLVGALLGLAIYNSTILDIALPPFAFRKLLAAAPASQKNSANVASLTGTKGQMSYTLADLAEFRPSLAAGLQQLLAFDGDVYATYCRDFVAPVERYGVVANEAIIPNGDKTPVTNENRQQFVDAYVRYLLETAVAKQFEPFKRGFFSVCAGNALSLFRAEEIELLIRGSDEALDVASLQAVAVYENWLHAQEPHLKLPRPEETEPVITWFWDAFASADPQRQRKLLSFLTGSDRIPAVGATSLVLRIVAGGDGWGGGGSQERERFPVARTCFNMLVLWHYNSREQLERKLWRAVDDSEGFGLK